MPGLEYPGSTYPAQYGGIPDSPLLAWEPVYPDRVRRQHGLMVLSVGVQVGVFPSAPLLAWLSSYPDRMPHRRWQTAASHLSRPSSFPLPLPEPCSAPEPPIAGGTVCVVP